MNLCCNISVPYNLVLSYEYLQNKQQISIEVIVEDGINAPNSKAVVLTSGKISIKKQARKRDYSRQVKFSTQPCLYGFSSRIQRFS